MRNLDQLSDAELISVVVQSSVGREAWRRFGSLNGLARAEIDELLLIPGIGLKRAEAIRAAFCLSSRAKKECYDWAKVLDSPEAIADLLREEVRPYRVEQLHVVLLNARNRLIGVERLGQGTVNSVSVFAVEVFRVALIRGATSIVLVHSHPSGDPSPSDADIRVTKDLVRQGQFLKIPVLDHVVLGNCSTQGSRDFVSLRELGHCWST